MQQLYNKEMKISESVVRLIKHIMNVAMGYALEKKMISVNPAEGVDLPKQKKKGEFRVRRTYGIAKKRDYWCKVFRH